MVTSQETLVIEKVLARDIGQNQGNSEELSGQGGGVAKRVSGSLSRCPLRVFCPSAAPVHSQGSLVQN